MLYRHTTYYSCFFLPAWPFFFPYLCKVLLTEYAVLTVKSFAANMQHLIWGCKKNKHDMMQCLSLRGVTAQRSDSPFVVLAVEEAIEYVTEGANMMEVVQDDHSGELCVHLLRVTLLCQVRQVLTQVLCNKRMAHILNTHFWTSFFVIS